MHLAKQFNNRRRFSPLEYEPYWYHGVLYITDFLSDSRNILSYNEFLHKWDITRSQFSTNNYVDIKMALRRYDCPTTSSKSLRFVESNVNLTFFNNTTVKGRELRNMITTNIDIDSLTPLKEWKRYSIDWSDILYNHPTTRSWCTWSRRTRVSDNISFSATFLSIVRIVNKIPLFWMLFRTAYLSGYTRN